MVAPRSSRPDGRATEGRRPVRVRARRRGGAGAARRRHRLRGRARRDGRHRRARLRRHPGHPPRARHRGRARHRAHARGPADDDARSELDWPALAAFPGTLVFYMGVRRAAADRRRRCSPPGASADEPVAVVEARHAALASARSRHARHDRRHRARAGRARPLDHGRRTGRRARRAALVARAAAAVRPDASPSPVRAPQASGLAGRLAELGAHVVEAPVIRIAPLPGPAPDPSRRTTSSA